MPRPNTHRTHNGTHRVGGPTRNPWSNDDDRRQAEVNDTQLAAEHEPVPDGYVRCRCGLTVRVRRSDGKPFGHHVRGIPCSYAPSRIPGNAPICSGCGESRRGCTCRKGVR